MVNLPRDDNANAILALKPGTTQVVTAATASNASTAFAAKTVVRVYASVKAHVAVGATPTATTGDCPVAAAAAEYFYVDSAEKIAVVKQTGETDGSLYITVMT